ncbi:hypothetical protein HW445_20700, partial [Streptomyces sp. UH6]|nr:hypothetical protein [Streptomyces sp. UH6]
MTTVLIIEPQSSGLELVARARDLGHTVVVLASTDSGAAPAGAHRVVTADT